MDRGWQKQCRWLFPLGAIFLGLAPFLLLEAGLRLCGVGRTGDSADSLSGFSHPSPLFEQHGAVYRTARAREPFFSAQEFQVVKPTNGFRIFCFGGSTVYGHPYQGDTAFPKWLELELDATHPTRSYQAINCGGVSYASYRLAPIVKEVLNYQPDLVIIATGENEFLEDRTYASLKSRSAARAWLEHAASSLRTINLARNWLRGGPSKATPHAAGAGDTQPLSSEARPRLDDISGYASYHRDHAWHDRIAAQFEESMRAMVNMCRQAGVPIILVKLGSNLRDCPPFKSEHRPGLTAEQDQAWRAAFDAATAAESRALTTALTLYRQAEDLDPEYALLAWRIARVLDWLGREREALEYYVRARDLDVCPLRTPKRHEQILATVAAETKTPLLDAASLLAAQSPDHIPGYDWYLDHVHPTIGGHQRIAQAIAARMRELLMVPAAAPWPEAQRRQAYARQLEQLGPRYLADGRRRVEWLENWSRRQLLFGETLPIDAPGYLRLGFRRLELGDDDAAQEAFGEAMKRDPGAAEVLKRHAEELVSQGRPQLARLLPGP